MKECSVQRNRSAKALRQACRSNSKVFGVAGAEWGIHSVCLLASSKESLPERASSAKCHSDLQNVRFKPCEEPL